MDFDVVWTEYAYEDFERIGGWLLQNWGKNAVKKFEREIDFVVSLLKKWPTSFQRSESNPIFRKILINKHTSLFFRVDESVVTLIALWSHARNPDSLEELLEERD